jgi:predicted metal-dependent hydrolase
MKEESVRLYAVSKLTWIKQQIENVQNQERQTLREYVSGENHYFKGQRYRLVISYYDGVPKVELSGTKYIKLFVRKDTTVPKRAELLKEWYRKELKELLPPLVMKWEEILGVSVKYWEIKQMKTKWGSCNTKTKRIIFNLELAKKPVHCIEYIVVHELAHLIERNHSIRYKSILDTYFPQWEIYKSELNEFIV